MFILGRFDTPARRILVAAVVFAFAALTGCERAPVSPMRIGTNLWPGYEPLYLARELGYIGPEIRLVEHTSAAGVIRDFRNGALDAAALTLDEVLQLVQDVIPVRIALVMDISDGGDAIIARPPYETMTALKGRRIGVEDTAVGAYLLTRALELNGIRMADIKVVPRSFGDHETAFLDHQVDAVVTFEPVRSRLLEAGGTIVFDSGQIPGEIVDVLIVSADFWDRQPARVHTLLTHWFRALEYLRTQPDNAARIMARRLKLEPKQVLQALQGLQLPDVEQNRRMLIGDAAGPDLLPTLRAMSEVMVNQHLLHRKPSLTGLLPSDGQWQPTTAEH